MKKKIAIKGMRVGLLMAAIFLIFMGVVRTSVFDFSVGIPSLCAAAVFLCIREIYR